MGCTDTNLKKNLKPSPAAPGIRQFETGAVRSSDADSVRYDLISPIALDEIAKTYQEGAAKYGDHNWLKGFPVSDLLNHAIRHIYLFLSGDRSEPHLPHAAWGLMAAIHSHKQWPELNKNLLGEGCTPPSQGEDKAAEVAGEPAFPLLSREDEAAGELGRLGYTEIKWEEKAGEPASSLGGNAASASHPCGSQLPCDDPASCPRYPYCDGTVDEFGEPLGCFMNHGVNGSCRLCAPRQSAPRQRHHIPVIEDALNQRGPFPVLYLSGPMSGYRDLNFPAFNKAAEELRKLGFPVLNPADFGQCAGMEWEDNLHRDLYILGCADIVVQLPGWGDSRGASLEYNTAVGLGKGVTSVNTLIDEWQ